MKTKTMFKIVTLLGLAAFSPNAQAAKNSDLGVFPSSAAYFIGYPNAAGSLTPARGEDAVLVASGAVKVISSSTTSGHKPFRVLNASGSEILSVTQAGAVSGTSFSGTAAALAANGANCSAGQYPLGVDAAGAVESCTSNVNTATALAANGANCSAGQYPLGVDASGAVESCTAAGIGDAVLNSTQTWSGANLFLSSVSVGPQVYTSTAITGPGATVSSQRSVYVNGWTLVASTTTSNATRMSIYGLRPGVTYQLHWGYVAPVTGVPNITFNFTGTTYQYASNGYRSDGSAITTNSTSATECNFTGGGAVGQDRESRGMFTFKIYQNDNTIALGFGTETHVDGTPQIMRTEFGCYFDGAAAVSSIQFAGGTNGITGYFKLYEQTSAQP